MLDQIAAVLNKADSIAVLPHVAADGDALGSSFALALALSGMGKKARVLLEEDIPFIYDFLPGKDLAEISGVHGRKYDLAAALDCGDIARLGTRKCVFEIAPVTVNIDHHPTNTAFAVYNYVDTGSSATGEIIYRLLELLGQKPGKEISICLYTAIAADTGGFRYSNTTPLTHQVTAELIKQGIDVADISRKIFDTVTYGKIRLMGAAISSLELVDGGRIAVMTVTNKMIRDSGAKEEDGDGIINLARNINGVEIAAMLRQQDNGEIKVNLRSNSNADVAAVASKYSGGGHAKAAGFTVSGDLQQVRNKLLDDLKGAL